LEFETSKTRLGQQNVGERRTITWFRRVYLPNMGLMSLGM